jgi:hypothetical protein
MTIRRSWKDCVTEYVQTEEQTAGRHPCTALQTSWDGSHRMHWIGTQNTARDDAEHLLGKISVPSPKIAAIIE